MGLPPESSVVEPPPALSDWERQRRAFVERRAALDAARQARDLAQKQRWGRAPGLLFNGTVIAAMVLLLVAASTPTLAEYGYLALLYLGLTLVVWITRARWWHHAPTPTGWRTSRGWFLVPFIAGCLTLALLYADVPFHLRFSLTRSTFDAAATRVEETPREQWVPVPGASVAGFPISEAHRFGNQVWFRYTGTSDLLDFHTRYIAYLPNGPRRSSFQGRGQVGTGFNSYAVTALGGGWYYVHDWAD